MSSPKHFKGLRIDAIPPIRLHSFPESAESCAGSSSRPRFGPLTADVNLGRSRSASCRAL
jgi:hypothetical protein